MPKAIKSGKFCVRRRLIGLPREGGDVMGEAQGILGNPGVGLIAMLVIGVIAGWIAEKVTASDHGIFTNILVGIAGAFIAGKLAEVLQVPVFGFFRTLIAATIGAIVLLFVWRRFRGPSA
jgi:uncharacterized membrane protein YeaQ/YmgE (transglycosylase-associated protein family)